MEGGPSSCEVKTFCQDKGFYECDEFEAGKKLTSTHKRLRGDACAKNPRAIRKMGLDT
jgi:hypothetical protein